MLTLFYGLCLGLAGYCGLYAAYCFNKRKVGEGISVCVLALMALGATAAVMAAI